MNSTLFKAILAMDSYNRGYDAGVKLDENSDQIGTKIGGAAIYDVKGDAQAQSAGFYAVAYTVGSETIISYRGTDKNFVWPWNSTGSDLANGYGVGAGQPWGEQAQLAFAFYNAVAGEGNHLTANISLTGHSLGAGFLSGSL